MPPDVRKQNAQREQCVWSPETATDQTAEHIERAHECPVIFVRGHHLEDQAHMEIFNKNRRIKQMAIDDNYLLDSGKGLFPVGEIQCFW